MKNNNQLNKKRTLNEVGFKNTHPEMKQDNIRRKQELQVTQ